MDKQTISIQVTNLHKSYGSTKAVDGVSFDVYPGEVYGYLGPNGAGKSTTIKMLTGLLKPDAGTILINGFDIQKQPLQAKMQFGYVPESGALYEKLTPFEYLQMVGRLHKMDEASLETKITDILEFFDMLTNKDQRMGSFSKGMKQRIVISGAILPNPPILFFDEPLNGLDANAVLLVKELVRKFVSQGKTVFYTSHILDVVEKVCDRVSIIANGQIVGGGSVKDLGELYKQSSLEMVFKELTHGEDAQAAVEAFTKNMNS
jgi:ABC-2 type transport system ATP-binding protein